MNPQLNESANKNPIFSIRRDMACFPLARVQDCCKLHRLKRTTPSAIGAELFQINADLRGTNCRIGVLKNIKIQRLLVAKILIKDAPVNVGALGDCVDAGTVYAFGGDFGCGGRTGYRARAVMPGLWRRFLPLLSHRPQ